VLEKPADIGRFKVGYRKGHEVATVNRALGVLRAAINWGRFQDPPLLSTTPFHRFGAREGNPFASIHERRLVRPARLERATSWFVVNAGVWPRGFFVCSSDRNPLLPRIRQQFVH
jgi:hypothetical protein